MLPPLLVVVNVVNTSLCLYNIGHLHKKGMVVSLNHISLVPQHFLLFQSFI